MEKIDSQKQHSAIYEQTWQRNPINGKIGNPLNDIAVNIDIDLADCNAVGTLCKYKNDNSKGIL